MILSAQSIRKHTIITPFSERTFREGMSYGLSSAGYDVRVEQCVWVAAGGFALASTVEHFHMPDNLVGMVHDKSTWARRGIALQNTVIEPGWRGWLTLEITNHSAHAITIPAGTPIAQIVFHLLDEPTKQPYSGRYQDQKQGPQGPRFVSY